MRRPADDRTPPRAYGRCMTNQRLTTLAAGAAVAGGLALLAKLAVLAVTDGAESTLVGALYFLGLGLLVVGTAGIALRLLERRPPVLRIVAALLSPVLFFALFLALDGILVPLFGDDVPEWAEAEPGVFATALIWLAAGGWVLRRGGSGRRRTATATC